MFKRLLVAAQITQAICNGRLKLMRRLRINGNAGDVKDKLAKKLF
jgi:hypothetical protein